MFRSKFYWRVVFGCLVASAISAAVAAEDLTGFLFGILAGVVVSGGAAWLVMRWLTSEMHSLSRSLHDGVFRESETVERAPKLAVTDELADVVDEVVSESRRRRDRFNRRQAELEQNSALLETVLGTMVEGVLVVDASEQVLFANQAFRALLGINHTQVVGRPLVEIARGPRIQEAARRIGATGESVQLEFEIARLKKTVALNAASLGSSNVQGAVLVLHDISELRRLERMRRDFASNVSHELKTPLTSIQAYADTLLDGALEDSGQNRTFLERIIQQSQRLQALIGDLLSLSKIETQSEMFDIQPVCVDEAIQSCADGHLAVAAGKGVDLQWAAVEGLRVMCDPEGLGQILDNLVDNALNYTAAEGHVSIRSRREGECCVIEVEDSGIGISREQQSRIFERFYRADKARSREVGGTGLGLAIVKHLSQAFGGSVSVTSELGAGSIFQVRLPLAESSAPDSGNP